MPHRLRVQSHRPGAAQVQKAGMAAGVAVYTGQAREHEVRIDMIRFNKEVSEKKDDVSVTDALAAVGAGRVCWIDVDGVHDVVKVQALCEGLGVHPLAMEDVLNPSTRAKVDDYGDHVLVVLKMAWTNQGVFELDQTSLLIGQNWVLSFQERRGDLWDGVRRRLCEGNGHLRSHGAAWLLHALLDAVVDGYFGVLDGIEDEVDAIEENSLEQENVGLPHMAHELRTRLGVLRRLIWPVREAMGPLLHGGSRLVPASASPFFRDLHDHLSQCIDLMDTCRDRLVAVIELHLAMESHRLNKVMRVLTVMATIFMPLTFIAGVYGMNFDYMPELRWTWGYPAVMILMALVGLSMALWFQWRKWLL